MQKFFLVQHAVCNLIYLMNPIRRKEKLIPAGTLIFTCCSSWNKRSTDDFVNVESHITGNNLKTFLLSYAVQVSGEKTFHKFICLTS